MLLQRVLRQESALLEKLPDVVGHALRGQRAGLDKTAFQAVDLRGGMAAITVGSLAFADHAPIPERYTADGEGVSRPCNGPTRRRRSRWCMRSSSTWRPATARCRRWRCRAGTTTAPASGSVATPTCRRA